MQGSSSNPNSSKSKMPILKTNEPPYFATSTFSRFGRNNSPWTNEKREIRRTTSLPSENERVSIRLDKAVEFELDYGKGLDPTMDPKKIRRIVSNRLSAQRARSKKVEHVTNLKNKVKHLEDVTSDLNSQIKDHKEKIDLLMMQNQSFQRLIELRLDDARISEIRLAMNEREVTRLKELERTLLCANNHILNEGRHDQMQVNQYHCQEIVASTSASKPPVPSFGEAETGPAADQYLEYLNLED